MGAFWIESFQKRLTDFSKNTLYKKKEFPGFIAQKLARKS